MNTCVGKLDYQTGADYKFTLYGYDACGMENSHNGTHIVYTNAVTGKINETVEIYSEFSCGFENGKSDHMVKIKQISNARHFTRKKF